jgi:hypothetical protein
MCHLLLVVGEEVGDQSLEQSGVGEGQLRERVDPAQVSATPLRIGSWPLCVVTGGQGGTQPVLAGWDGTSELTPSDH